MADLIVYTHDTSLVCQGAQPLFAMLLLERPQKDWPRYLAIYIRDPPPVNLVPLLLTSLHLAAS